MKVKERERRAAKWRRIKKKIEGEDEQEKWLARGKTKVHIALFQKRKKKDEKTLNARFSCVLG